LARPKARRRRKARAMERKMGRRGVEDGAGKQKGSRGRRPAKSEERRATVPVWNVERRKKGGRGGGREGRKIKGWDKT